jgi:RNA polymerase sigma-70 factor (ECF subfamily)
VADQVSAEQALAARQRLTSLLQTMDRLPPRMRQAFRLCKLEERTREDAARQMGISVKAVEKQITAALKALTWPTR